MRRVRGPRGGVRAVSARRHYLGHEPMTARTFMRDQRRACESRDRWDRWAWRASEWLACIVVLAIVIAGLIGGL